ncbi:MAG: hypothetical protein FWD69_10125 [Polyangiaceae bacterium]|nr:hypothetical protein [Polyangiaceae bacterium]
MKPVRVPYRRVHTGSFVGDQAQRTAQSLAAQQTPFSFGRLVSVALSGGVPKIVNHGLGMPAACMAVRQNYDARGFPVALAEAAGISFDELSQLALIANETCVLDLWFYPRSSNPVDASKGQSP